jgi:predicted RNase H-like HicB family nuclease
MTDPAVQELLDRDYPMFVSVEKRLDGRELYAVGLIDFPGCIAQGATIDEAREKLDAAKPAFFKKLLDLGVKIPKQTSLPAIIPGYVGFYDPATGASLATGSAAGKPRAEVQDGSLKVRMVQTA